MVSICNRRQITDRLFYWRNMRIDYFAYRSGMKNWNAGLKALLAVGTLCLVIGLNKIGTSLFVVLCMGALTLFVGRIPFKVYLHYMTVPLVFMVCSGAAIAVGFAGTPVGDFNLPLHFFYLYVTRRSLFTALEVFCKALAGMSALYMLAFSTPMHEVIRVLQRLHLPRLVVELMNLIYRYIFILFDIAHQMQTAAKARLGFRNYRQSLRTFAAVGGNLFLVALKKAGAYYDALLARGYDGKLEFLTEENSTRPWQVLGSLCYFSLLILTALAG